MNDLLTQLWDKGIIQLGVWETIYMTFISAFFAYLVGLPLGVLLCVTDKEGIHPIGWLNKLLGILVNVFRSIPFVILMIAMLPAAKLIVGTSLGNKAMIVTLIIAAIPYVARMAESSIKEVDSGVIEAAQAMGASPMQIIRKVLLPEALHSIVLGITLAVIALIGYSAMAGTLGGGGLGDLAIRYGYQRFQMDVMLITVVVLIVMVQSIQSLGDYFSKKLNKNKL